MAILPKVIYRFNVTFIKIPIVVFTEINKNNSKIHFELKKKKIRIAKAILRKNNKAEAIKISQESTNIKTRNLNSRLKKKRKEKKVVSSKAKKNGKAQSLYEIPGFWK